MAIDNSIIDSRIRTELAEAIQNAKDLYFDWLQLADAIRDELDRIEEKLIAVGITTKDAKGN